MSIRKLWMSVIEYIGMLIRYVLTPIVLPIVERNLFPDVLLRMGIRQELEMELVKQKKLNAEEKAKTKSDFVKELRTMPIAIAQTKANDQHYEVPDEFYQMVLGPYMKYSSGYWPADKPHCTLAESEVYMLEMYCERAQLFDGMKLIDLGCGWGSVTLYMAAKYPKASIVSISNSNSQREYIMGKAKERGLNNVQVYTGDISTFDLPTSHHHTADRVISIEMFEHMKNYSLLMHKISNWMKDGGLMFIHIFTSVDLPGHYKEGWMTDNFFTGGTLPSDDLLLYFQEDLKIVDHWRVNGAHYQKTLEAWCRVMDRKQSAVLPLLGGIYGKDQAMKRYVYWRLFFIACAEFFGAHGGEEYLVSHYLFKK